MHPGSKAVEHLPRRLGKPLADRACDELLWRTRSGVDLAGQRDLGRLSVGGERPGVHDRADDRRQPLDRVREALPRLPLDNLLENAIKYTPKDGTITVRAFADHTTATLEIEDTGIGISAADRERIFERFYRADRARSRDTGGTGLGLAIVKHLAAGIDGDVEVESEQGRGSRFSVRAPAAPIS